MGRLSSSVSVILGLLLLVPAAHAAKPVRVLLSQDAERVRVTAESELNVRFPGGEVWATGRTLEFTADPRAVRVNGEYLPSDRVIVRGEGQELHITVEAVERPARVGRERRVRLPSAVFPRLQAASKRRPVRSGAAREGQARPELVVGGDLYIATRGDRLALVNSVDLEEYVEGVVPAEMNANWHLEALKVQAVATRTYVLYQQMLHSDRDHDVVATVMDQVYRGRMGVNTRVREAVAQTRGLAVTYEERPILASFSSTAAGPTEDARNVWSKELPYLTGVDCPFDRDSPFYEWTSSFPLKALETNLGEEGLRIGTIATLTPYDYSRAGRVAHIRILHAEGELVIRGEDLRRVIGYRVIPSTRFTIEALGRDVILSGYGAGHAVGLCQWGAKELAEMGYPFHAILTYYFPGTTISPTWRLDPIPLER